MVGTIREGVYIAGIPSLPSLPSGPGADVECEGVVSEAPKSPVGGWSCQGGIGCSGRPDVTCEQVLVAAEKFANLLWVHDGW